MARVISLSFANVKNADYQSAVTRICQLLTDLYRRNRFLLKGDLLSEKEKEEYENISKDMPEVVAAINAHLDACIRGDAGTIRYGLSLGELQRLRDL